MANIQIRPAGNGAYQIVINGIDYSHDIYNEGLQLVRVGEGERAEVGLQVILAVSRLTLGDEQDIVVTDQFESVAQRVHSIAKADD